MSKSKNVVSTATARQWFRENPKFVPDGDASLGSTARGRLSAKAREVFNAESGMTLSAEPFQATVPLEYVRTQPSGRKVKAVAHVTPKELRALVPNAPERGKLSAAHLQAAAENYAAQVVAARASAE